MNNMHSVWAKRFAHYMNEVMKYMRFVFTGHIAIVLVFVLGAGGYQYSEWLKVVSGDFQAEWLVAIIVGAIVAFSSPVTLIREPDQVYLLPLESQMPKYFKKAVNWTFWSQVLIPVLVYIVAIPLLKAVTVLTVGEIWLGAALVVVLKYFNVQIEFNYRYANRGQAVFIDRVTRAIISMLAIESMVSGSGIAYVGIFIVLFVFYNVSLYKKTVNQPVPYEHFVRLEQNRMMRFYRFANYFSDVPHLRGSIRRRAWLDVVYKWIPFKKESTQTYLIFRTFIRTDDHFYLWIRLTAISAVVALFVDIPVVTWIVAAALAFATTIQLKYALLSSGEFRMDMLYPISSNAREKAVQTLLRACSIIQAVIVMLCAIGQPYFYGSAVIILVVSEVTYRLAKK